MTDNRQLDYQVRVHRRAKRLKLVVLADGTVRVTIPPFVGLQQAREFFDRHRQYVSERLAQRQQFSRQQPDLWAHDRRHYLKHRQAAGRLAARQVRRWADFYSLSHNRITIKNNRSNWGSCSGRGNLNFHYKILFLPPDLQDYLVVHEVCHLKYLDHSPAYWRLVAKAVPEYRDRRRRLADLSKF